MTNQSHHPRCRHIRRLPPPQWWTRHTHPKDRYPPGLKERENEKSLGNLQGWFLKRLLGSWEGVVRPTLCLGKYEGYRAMLWIWYYDATSLMWYNPIKLKLCPCKDQTLMCHCRMVDHPLQIPVPPLLRSIHFTSSKWKHLKIGIQSPPCHVHHVDTSWAPTANATHRMRQQILRNAFGHCMVKVFNGKTWWLRKAILRPGFMSNDHVACRHCLWTIGHCDKMWTGCFLDLEGKNVTANNSIHSSLEQFNHL